MEQDNLIELYGGTVHSEIIVLIKELAIKSNFHFENEYIKTGCSFIAIHAERIINKEESKPTLKNLVTQSFGEAAIATFNR